MHVVARRQFRCLLLQIEVRQVNALHRIPAGEPLAHSAHVASTARLVQRARHGSQHTGAGLGLNLNSTRAPAAGPEGVKAPRQPPSLRFCPLAAMQKKAAAPAWMDFKTYQALRASLRPRAATHYTHPPAEAQKTASSAKRTQDGAAQKGTSSDAPKIGLDSWNQKAALRA